MNALVQVRDGSARASSLNVARSFERQHRDVMRSVRRLTDQRHDLERNFARMILQVEAGKSARRDSHYYEMDRKGFTLLAMGFTGPKALEWKIAYIDAFDRMEAALHAMVEDEPADDDLLPAAAVGEMKFVDRLRFEPPNIQLAYVREMRMARGRPGAIVAMRELGWEEQDAGAPDALLAASNPIIKQVLQWVQDRTQPEPGHRVRTMAMYSDFVRWCGSLQLEVLTLTAFGRSLSSLGYPSRRSNATYRDGLRLR